MHGLFYHKNKLLKLLKSCKIMCDEHGKVTMVRAGGKTLAFTMQVKHGILTLSLHGDTKIDGCKLLVSINHSKEHSVQLTGDELCTLLTNIDLYYPNIIKKQQYQEEGGRQH